jgi:spore maturation protein A
MESLAEFEKTRVCKVRGGAEQTDIHRTASKEMCTFLVLNISSLQLIPVNMIAYRGQYGSVNPTAIIMPALIATGISTIAAIIFCKCMAVRE